MRRRVATLVTVGVALLGVLVAALALADGGGGGSMGGQTSSVAGPSGPALSGSGPDADDEAPAAERGTAAAPSPDGALPPDAQPPGPTPGSAGRDLVRTAQLGLEVPDPAAATRAVRTAVATAGGIVAQEQLDDRGSWLEVRVPVAVLDRVVDDLATLGTVRSRSAHTEDATAQIVDLDGRLATQQASVTRVRALLAQATTIGEVVTVEAELTQREADLESLQRRLAALRDRTALSTLTVELRRTFPGPTVDDAPPAGFGSGLSAGWTGLTVIGTALATAAGFLLPFLPVLLVAAAAVWLVVRRRRRTRPARRSSGATAEQRSSQGGPDPEGV